MSHASNRAPPGSRAPDAPGPGPGPAGAAGRLVGVDATGTFCPVPILRLASACRAAPAGATLELRATDPAMRADVQAWCEATGHRLLSLEQQGEVHVARVQKQA